MSLVRNSQRDDRRRRALVEAPFRDTQTGGQSSTKTKRPKRPYTDDALAAQQARITDLLPIRHWSLTVVLLLSLTVVAALECLHVFNHRWQRELPDADLSMLTLHATGNLAAWFSSLLLLTAALLTVLIYTIRRHKIDDYRGRYGIWIWAGVCWLLASVDATAGIHRIVQAGLTRLTGSPLYGDGTAWWIAVYTLAFLSLGIRLLIEIWTCRPASCTLVTAAGMYLITVCARLGLFLSFTPPLDVMLQGGTQLLGHLLLAFSMLLYARHVFLDAQGMVKPRRRRPRQRSQPAAAQSGTPKRASATIPFVRGDEEEAPVRSRPSRQPAAAQETEQRSSRRASSSTRTATPTSHQPSKRTVTDVDDDQEPDSSDSEERSLSKSDRKKQRKQRRRERRAA